MYENVQYEITLLFRIEIIINIKDQQQHRKTSTTALSTTITSKSAPSIEYSRIRVTSFKKAASEFGQG